MNGAVPPLLTFNCTLPVWLPLQLTLVTTGVPATIAAGAVIEYVFDITEQPFASVAVTLYNPVFKPLRSSFVLPLFHK